MWWCSHTLFNPGRWGGGSGGGVQDLFESLRKTGYLAWYAWPFVNEYLNMSLYIVRPSLSVMNFHSVLY